MNAGAGAGTMVGADVRLERCIGAGGMGSVWVGRELSSGREVAVKLMAGALAADEVLRERFAREASIGLALESPHIVRTLGHGTIAGDLPYIVMELCRGES